MNKVENLTEMSQSELIDSALLKLVAGANSDGYWKDSCGDEHTDWCFSWTSN